MNTSGDVIFLSDEIEIGTNSNKFEGMSQYEIDRHKQIDYLKKKGYANFTDLEKGLYHCTGWCCYCGGLDRYGYCVEYDYAEWREGDLREKRNKEIWGLFSVSEYRPRADTNYECDFYILPYALGGIKKKISKNKLPIKRFSNSPRHRRNKTY